MQQPGPELVALGINLKQTDRNLKEVRACIEDLQDKIKAVERAIDTVDDIEDTADSFGNTVAKLQLTLKLMDKAGPLIELPDHFGIDDWVLDIEDKLLGEIGDPELDLLGIGTSGNDVLQGGNRINLIHALGGNDKMLGGGGDDVLVAGPGGDELDGGEGTDVAPRQ